MKRNLHFFAAAVATISLLASCAEEIIDETTLDEDSDVTVTVPSDGMVTLTFKADYPNPVTEEAVAPQQADTRTTIAEDGTVAWEIGDEITLYYMEGNTPANAPATALTAGPSADFQVTIPDGVTEVYAVYPAGKGELTTDGVFKVKTGEVQNGSFEQANYAAAWTEVSDEMNISFKNAVGLFKVKIPEGGIIKDGEVNHTIKSIAIAGKKAELAFLGDVAVTLENGALSFSDPENALAEAVIELDSEARNAGYVYIPSLPVTSADGFVFRFQNTEGKYLPAAVTKDDKVITLDRGHLKPVNTACESVIFDWYFAADGQGDGKSASSPAGVAEFQKLLNDSQYLYGERRLDGARLNLAAGTYSLTEQLNIKGVETGDITIVGAGLEESMIDGAEYGNQMVACASNKNLNLSKLTFQNATSNINGAVMNNGGSAGKLVCNEVGFKNNYSNKNSGAIYIGGTSGAEFRNCVFEGNKTKTNVAGAVATGGSSKGTVAFYGCRFEGNLAGESATSGAQGGAIYHATADMLLIDNCVFDSNSGYTMGGAIYGNLADGKIFISRSLFVGNEISKGDYKDLGAAIYSKGPVGVYNCTFNYNHAATKSCSVFSATKYIVANSTFVESMKVSHGVICNRATEEHHSTIINNIVITTSTTDTHCALSISATAANNNVDCGYNLVTRIQDGFTAASNDVTTYTPVVKTDFGFEDAVDKTNKCYAWLGDIANFEGFSRCNLSNVETMIKANTVIGNEFWSWLKSIKVGANDATQVDVRGVKRDPDLMWPGSYQDILQQSTESEE